MAGAGGQEVGRINVRVVPDTSFFREQLQKDLNRIEREMRGEIEFTADFDSAGLSEKVAAAARAAKAKVPIEADVKSLDLFQKRMLSELASAHRKLETTVPLTVDGEAFRRQVEESVKGTTKDLHVKIDSDLGIAVGQREELLAQVQAIKQLAEREPIKLKLDPEFDYRLRQSLAQFDKPIKLQLDPEFDYRLRQRLTPDLDGFQQKALADVKAAAAGIEAKIPLTADGESFRRELATRVKEVEHTIRATVPVHLELAAGQRAKIAAEVASLKAEAAAGSAAGGLFGGISNIAGGAVDALSGMRAFGIGLVPIIGILSLVAPGIALLSGALVTLPGIAMAALAPLGALALGFKGIGKALDESGITSHDKKGKLKIGPELTKLMDQVGGVFEKGLLPVFNQVKGIFPQLGAAITPVANGLVTLAQQFTNAVTTGRGFESIKSIFTNVGDAIGRAAPGVAAFTDGMLTLADKLAAKFPKLADSFSKVGDQFLGWVDKVTTADPTTGVSQFDTAMSNLKGTLAEVSGLIGDIFSWGWDTLGSKDLGTEVKVFAGELRSLVTDTLPAMQKAFTTMATALEPITMVIDGVTSLNRATGGWLGKILGFGIGDAFEVEPDAPAKAGEKAAKGFSEGFKGMLLGQGGAPLGQDLSQALIPTGGPAGTEAGKGFLDNFQNAIKSPPPINPPAPTAPIPGLATDPQKTAAAFDGVIKEIQAKLSQLGPAVQQALSVIQPALDGMKNGLVAVFDNIGPLLTGGITSAIPQVITSFGQIGTAITTQFAQLPAQVTAAFTGVTSAAQGALATLVSTVQSKAGEIVSELSSWPAKFVAALGGLGSALTGAGSDLVQGFINGVNAKKGEAIAAARDMAQAAAAAARAELGIKSPSKVFHDIGQYSATGFQEGLEGGFQGVITRAKELAGTLASAMKDGVVPPGLKDQLKKEMAELGLEYDQLKVKRDALAPGDKEGRKALSEQMKQVTTIKDQLKLQSDQLGFSDKYGKDQQDITQQLGGQLSKMVDIGKGFATANLSQFENDVGISGNGAIPTLANIGLDWASGMLNKTLTGLTGGGGGQTVYNVGSTDEAIALDRRNTAKQALQFTQRST